MGTVSQFRRFVGDTMQNLVSMLGTERDKSYHNEYTLAILDRNQLDSAYRGDWVAKKIVNVPAKDATRAGRNWQATTKQIELIEAEEKRVNFQGKLKHALIKSRLYGGAALVMGLGDDAAQPLNIERVQKGSLKYLHALACHDLKDGPLVEDVNDPDFGLPDHYLLNPLAGQNAETKIHRSRIVRLVPEPFPDRNTVGNNPSWGDSVLQAVNDAVMNVAVSSGAVAYLMQEMKLDVVKIPDFMKNMADPSYKASIIERFALANQTKSLTSTLIMDREEEWDRVEATFAGLPDVMKLYLLIASGAADIPATRLLGQSAVGLNATGDGDLRNYYDHIAAEQATVLSPALVILDEVMIRSALGSRPKEIWYEWAPLWQTSDAENADIAKKKADTTKVYVDAGVIDPGILEKVVYNQLVEDGFYPGIEKARAEWEAEGGGLDEEDPEVKSQFNELRGRQPEDEEDTPESRRAKLKVVGDMDRAKLRAIIESVLDKEFDEDQVERDENGKFASGGGGGGGSKKESAGAAYEGMSVEQISAIKVTGGSKERVAMRAALKSMPKTASYKPERDALQGKVLESFKKDYDKAVAKGNSSKASELAAKTASYAKSYGKPDPISSKMTAAQANLGYSQKEVAAAKEVAASAGITGAQYSPTEAKAFNDLASMAGTDQAKAMAKHASAKIQSNSSLKGTGITPGEAAHIVAYSGHSYKATNGALRQGVMSEKQWGHVAQLNQALDKLPDYRGTVYRKTTLTAAQAANYQVGMIIEERGFTSSAKEKGIWSGSVHFEIASKTGKDIEKLSMHGASEKEVLFRNGTRFRVTGKSGNTIRMEEVGYATIKYSE